MAGALLKSGPAVGQQPRLPPQRDAAQGLSLTAASNAARATAWYQRIGGRPLSPPLREDHEDHNADANGCDA